MSVDTRSPSSNNTSALWRYFGGQAGASDDFEMVDKSQASQESLITPEGRKTPPKRLIICCDGTWQSSVTDQKNVPSNVTRLARSFSRTGIINKDKDGDQSNGDAYCQQVVYYSAGIGAKSGTYLTSKMMQGAVGEGLHTDVIEAYTFIVLNYAPHDEICCFGFSRGAFTARAVAGLITDIGIIQPQELADFPILYDIYRKSDHNNSFDFRQSPEYQEWITGVKGFDPARQRGGFLSSDTRATRISHSLPPEFTRVVKVVGVFDTVGSLGIPLSHLQQRVNWLARNTPLSYLGVESVGFHNTDLSRYIKHAYHALALDENDVHFSPTLWCMPKADEQAPASPTRTLHQLADNLRDLLKAPSLDQKKITKAWKDMISAEMYEQLRSQDPNTFQEPELKQVWFPGAHMNIGGGNSLILQGLKFDCEQIALITLAWMCDQIKPHIQLDNTVEDKGGSCTLINREIAARNELLEYSRQYAGINLLGFKLPNLSKIPVDMTMRLVTTIANAQCVDDWALGPIVSAPEFMKNLIPFEVKTRTPMEFKADDAGNKIGTTNESVHPSVEFRKERSRYHPPALSGWNRRRAGLNGWEWEKEIEPSIWNRWTGKDLYMPEETIPRDSFSRMLADFYPNAKAFIDRDL